MLNRQCQLLNPELKVTIQHRWKRKSENVKSAGTWGGLRRRWSPGFEILLDEGLSSDIFHREVYDEVMVFRWLFIPWLQTELDSWKNYFNTTPKRADKNKILPHGRPDLIFTHPATFNAKDYGINVNDDVLIHIEEVRGRYAPPQHEVFQLVPPEFKAIRDQCYGQIGRPTVSFDSCWDVYWNLLGSVRHHFTGLSPQDRLKMNEIAAAAIALEGAAEAEPGSEIQMQDCQSTLNGDDEMDQVMFVSLRGVQTKTEMVAVDQRITMDLKETRTLISLRQ